MSITRKAVPLILASGLLTGRLGFRKPIGRLAPLSVASLAPRWARSKAPSGLAAVPW